MEDFVDPYWPLIFAGGVVLLAIVAVAWQDWVEDEKARKKSWEAWAKKNGGK